MWGRVPGKDGGESNNYTIQIIADNFSPADI